MTKVEKIFVNIVLNFTEFFLDCLTLFCGRETMYLQSVVIKKVLSEVGFEPTPSFEDQKSQIIEKGISLESGALDRSAILTYC